jgi:hypothetical protein
MRYWEGRGTSDRSGTATDRPQDVGRGDDVQPRPDDQGAVNVTADAGKLLSVAVRNRA